MARRTRSLKRTCENLIVRESEVAFSMALHALDLAYGRVSHFGKPMCISAVGTPSALEVRQQTKGVA